MTLLQAIVIGIVQGLTEFLPISSTAHMRIVPALLGWKDPGSAFSAVIQLGTLVAVLVYFRQDLLRIAAAVLEDLRLRRFSSSPDSRLGWMIAVGTLPIVVIGLLFKDEIDTTLRSLYIISYSLIGVALLLAAAELWVRRHGKLGRDLDHITWKDAMVVGVAQAAALVPGTSRSGATLLGGLASGLNRETAARYSFLLSVPAVFAAAMLKLVEERATLMGTTDQATSLMAGLMAATLVGYLSIGWLLRFLRKRSTFVFIVYRILLGVLLLYLLQSGRVVDDVDSGSGARSPAVDSSEPASMNASSC